jgi:hypothetical protein
MLEVLGTSESESAALSRAITKADIGPLDRNLSVICIELLKHEHVIWQRWCNAGN